jgi:hypothetical protein
MVALVSLNQPCSKCGKNKFMEEILHVNGREEKRHTCLYCTGTKIRTASSINDDGNFVTRNYVRQIYTERNLDEN